MAAGWGRMLLVLKKSLLVVSPIWEGLDLELSPYARPPCDRCPMTGTDYVRRIQAYFCSLCHKIIRGDSSHGARAVRKHCRGVTHISHYNELHPPEQSEGEVSGDEGEKAEDGKNGEEEAEGEAVVTLKEEEGEGEDEEAEGEEEEVEGEEAVVKTEVKAETGDNKEAEQNEKVDDDKDAKEEEEELDEEEDEGMAEEKEEGWDEEVGDDFTAP